MRSIKTDLTLRRLDGARTDAPQCLKGKPCGERCIPRTSECQTGKGYTPLSEVDRQAGAINKRLSTTEKVALVGLGAAALTSSAALPIYQRLARPLSQTTQNLTRENAEQLARVLSQNANQTGAEFTRGAVEELGRTVNSATNAGWARHRSAQEKATEALRSATNKTKKQAAATITTATNRFQESAQKARSGSFYQTLNRMEPKSAKRVKRALGIKADSLQPRADQRPKCGPTSKPCGDVCIPRKNKCSEGRGTTIGQKVVGGIRKAVNSEAAGVVAGLGVIALGAHLGYKSVKTPGRGAEEAARVINNAHYERAQQRAKNYYEEWAQQQQRQAGRSRSTGSYNQGSQSYSSAWEDYVRQQRRQQQETYRRTVKEATRPAAEERVRTVLGVEPNAPKSEVRKRFKKWAMKNHPDRGGDTATFQEISAIITDYYKDSKDPSVWAKGFGA